MGQRRRAADRQSTGERAADAGARTAVRPTRAPAAAAGLPAAAAGRQRRGRQRRGRERRGGSGSGGTTPPADAGDASGRQRLDARRQWHRLPDRRGTCASGFCVDGVCCDSACDTLCHGCNLSGSRGTCKAFAAGSQCAPPSCTTTGDDLIPARTCDSSGNCNAAGAAQSCGRYRCQNDACLRSCSSSNACVSGFRCFQNRCF